MSQTTCFLERMTRRVPACSTPPRPQTGFRLGYEGGRLAVGSFSQQQLTYWAAHVPDPWVLKYITRSNRLQFRRRLPPFSGIKITSTPHPSKVRVLLQEVRSLLQKGAIVRVEPHAQHVDFYSTYFMVPKRNGTFHMVLGLRGLNVFMKVLQLWMLQTVDVLQVDSILKDAGDGTASTDVLKRCQELKTLTNKIMETLIKLNKADEPVPVRNYYQKKQEEERRLQVLMERLTSLSLELSPPGPNSKPQEEECDEDEEEEEEDDDDDDDDDDEEEEDEEDEENEPVKPPAQPKCCTYTVLSDFKEEWEGDLSIQRGEVLKIVRKTADGWWLAQNAKGYRGVVPKTYLKPTEDSSGPAVGVNEDSGDSSGERAGGEDRDDDDDDEEDDDEDDDEVDDEDEEEEEEEEDDGAGAESSEVQEKRGSRMSNSNWSTVKRALAEVDATEVLSAMGAIPSGFRPSTLTKLLSDEGPAYRGSYYVQPGLSQSQLSFKDLFLDADTGRVRARHVKTSVCFSLWSCKMISTPGVGVQVLSRHIRLCAFNGAQVLSNIHTVRATYTGKSPKTWTFSPRMAGVLPALLDGECFLRCSSESADLGILFELGVTFIRNSTGERGDLSCGWAFLKLTDSNGLPLPARTYELAVNAGVPYEQDVDKEASVSTAGNVIQQMFRSRRQAKLIVKIQSPNSRIRAQLSLLPDTLLFSLSCVHILALHRQLLADALLMDRPTMQNADMLCSPVLATFPALLDQPDLMDALKGAWADAESSMNRAQKRDLAYLKQEFAKVYMSSVYYLLRSPSLPCQRWADPPCEELRARVTYAVVDGLKHALHTTGQSGSLQVLVDPTPQHFAFDISELTYDLLRLVR